MRVFLSYLPRDLDWQGVEHAMEESCGVEGKEQVYKALNGQLYNMDLDLQREAKRLITLLTDKVPQTEHVYLYTCFVCSKTTHFVCIYTMHMGTFGYKHTCLW